MTEITDPRPATAEEEARVDGVTLSSAADLLTQGFTHKELIVLSDVLRRVKDGARDGTTDHLIEAAKFTPRPEFTTALEKINEAVIASPYSES